ncbi:MAG: proline dehydrogenase family protein [Trueperaceae bacterium]
MSRYRALVLAVAHWGPIERLARARGLRLGAGRFVAGETLHDGLQVANELTRAGRYPILDLLGEFVDHEEAAVATTDAVTKAIRGYAAVPEPRRLSVKPTQIGLGLDPDLALTHARRLARDADAAGVALCLDMEDHPHVDDTLRIVTTLLDEGHHHVSTVLQSYLHRTPDDLDRLLARDPVPELRLVKGAYAEPPSVAHPRKVDVDRAFREATDALLAGGGLVHVATHDAGLIRHAQRQRDATGVPRERLTFQLLHGVMPKLQERLVQEGESVGVYLPFGSDWYGYFARRLAERPANLALVVRGLFG